MLLATASTLFPEVPPVCSPERKHWHGRPDYPDYSDEARCDEFAANFDTTPFAPVTWVHQTCHEFEKHDPADDEPESSADFDPEDDESPGDMWDPLADPDEYCDECDSYLCDCWERD